jgi:hypothetical protein
MYVCVLIHGKTLGKVTQFDCVSYKFCMVLMELGCGAGGGLSFTFFIDSRPFHETSLNPIIAKLKL